MFQSVQLMLAGAIGLLAQSLPDLEWQSTPFTEPGELHGVLTVPAGVLVWGETGTDANLQASVSLCQHVDGEPEWSWYCGLEGRSRFWAAAAHDGNFLLAGEWQPTVGPARALLCCFSGNGDTLWLRTPAWSDSVVIKAISPSSMEGWIVCGSRGYKALLAGLTETGDTLWTREQVFRESYENTLADLVVLPDGRIVACGQSYHDWHEWINRYGILAWYTPGGELQEWQEFYDSRLLTVCQLADGRVAATGEFQHAYLPVWIGSASENLVYHQFGQRDSNLLGMDSFPDPAGGLFITGYWQVEAGDLEALLLKLDNQGAESWRAAFPVCGFDIAQGLAYRPDGSFLLAGACLPSRSTFLLGTGSDAAMEWQEYGSPRLEVRGSSGQLQLRWSRMPLGPVGVRIYNLLGQQVVNCVRGTQLPTEMWITMELPQLSAGTYIVAVAVGAELKTASFFWIP